MKNKRDWRILQSFLEAALILAIAYAERIFTWVPLDSNFFDWSFALITTFLAICFAFEAIHYFMNRKNIKEGCYLLIGAIFMMIAVFCLFKGIQLSKGSMALFFCGFFQVAGYCLVFGAAPFCEKHLKVFFECEEELDDDW